MLFHRTFTFFFFFLITQIFFRTVLKKKFNILRPVVGFTVCNTVMDHLFVNNAVQLLVEHIIQWGQYGRCTQSLGSANGCAGCMLGGRPQEHCRRSRCSVERLMPTAYSWQSVSSPPTTMCHWRCGKRCLNCSLNPAAAGGLSAFDLFLSKGSNAHTSVRLKAASAFTAWGGKKVKALSTCYRTGVIQIKWNGA